MMEFLLNLINTWSVISSLLLVAAIKTKREHRARQLLMPAVAIIYALVALYVLYRFNDGIREALALLPGMNRSVSSGLYLLENSLIVLGFLIVKPIVMPILKKLFNDGEGISAPLADRIYEYDGDTGLWFVVRRISGMRDLYRALYWASLVLTSLIIAFANTFASWPAFVSIAFPAIAALVLGEFYFSIDGLTKDEYENDILGERDNARKVANFGPLRQVLRSTFPDRVLSDSVRVSSRDAYEASARLADLTTGTSHAQRIAGEYFTRLRDERHDVDVNLADASAALMSGSSVLFMNPFYPDLTPYLSLPAYYELLQGRRCLIILGRDSLDEDIGRWISNGLASITGVPDLWNIHVLDAIGRDSMDVGLLRFADIYNLDLLKANDDFLKDVGLIILAEPSRMIAGGQVGLPLVLSRCSRVRTPTFAAFDGNHDGLVDALSHLVKTSLTEVVATALPPGVAFDVVWRGEGDNMHSVVMPSIGRYLGVGVEIGAVAMKYQVSQVHWVGADTFPVTDMRWIAEQYYAQINSFADLELSQDALKAALQVHPNPWSLPQDDNYFLVVEDEAHNIYETLRRYSTRATQAGFFNVISEEYLLRDYMIDNKDIFSADAKAIPSLVPDYVRTERNAVLRMVLALYSFGMTEAELRHEFELLDWRVPSDPSRGAAQTLEWEAAVITALRRGIREHTGVDGDSIRFNRGSYASSLGPDDLQVYRIPEGSGIDRLVDDMRPAYFYVEDEREDSNFIGALLYGQVYQSLLPGQFVTYAGKYYEVLDIDPVQSRGGVVLRRAGEHIRDRRAYRQLRTYELVDVVPSDAVGATVTIGGVEIVECLADIGVSTHGYIECSSRSSLGTGRRVLMEGIPHRQLDRKAVLRVRLPGASAEVRKTITLLLNETFTTIFPNAHQYVCAVTDDSEEQFNGMFNSVVVNDEHDSIYIVEDSMMDMGLIVAVERNWDRLLEIITDYLTWNGTPRFVPDASTATFAPVHFPDLPVSSDTPDSWWRRLLARVRGIFQRTPPVAPTSPLPPPPAPAAATPLLVDDSAVVDDTVEVDIVGQPHTAEAVGDAMSTGEPDAVTSEIPVHEVTPLEVGVVDNSTPATPLPDNPLTQGEASDGTQ